MLFLLLFVFLVAADVAVAVRYVSFSSFSSSCPPLHSLPLFFFFFFFLSSSSFSSFVFLLFLLLVLLFFSSFNTHSDAGTMGGHGLCLNLLAATGEFSKHCGTNR